MRIGLLDFGDLPPAHIVELSQLAERLGYSRYWLAEHYDNSTFGNSTIMATLVAAATRRIRVGPGGVLLRFQSPYAVVDNAILLAQQFPERFDFGLAGGSASLDRAMLLADGRFAWAGPEYFEAKIEAVAHFAKARRRPVPPFWVLGSGGARATLAGRLGLSYSISLFHRDTLPSPDVVTMYRDAFAQAGHRHAPAINVAASVTCLEPGADPAEALRRHPGSQPPIVGVAAEVRERLEATCARYDVDEVIMLESSAGLERRRTALQALAEEVGLDDGAETLLRLQAAGRC